MCVCLGVGRKFLLFFSSFFSLLLTFRSAVRNTGSPGAHQVCQVCVECPMICWSLARNAGAALSLSLSLSSLFIIIIIIFFFFFFFFFFLLNASPNTSAPSKVVVQDRSSSLGCQRCLRDSSAMLQSLPAASAPLGGFRFEVGWGGVNSVKLGN